MEEINDIMSGKLLTILNISSVKEMQNISYESSRKIQNFASIASREAALRSLEPSNNPP